MDIRSVRQTFARHGLVTGVHYITYRILNKLVGYQAFVGVVTAVESVEDPKSAQLPDGFRGEFIDADRLGAYVGESVELSESDVALFTARGDRCYGVFVGDDLVSYSLYSRAPTPMTSDLTVHFDGRFANVFKSFTLPEFRGHRLHSVAMRQALPVLHREDGCAGLIAYVESSNYGSLRSGARMGHREFGVIRQFNLFGVRRLFRSPGCAAFGFEITIEASSGGYI